MVVKSGTLPASDIYLAILIKKLPEFIKHF
jgi:hypothetical protein